MSQEAGRPAEDWNRFREYLMLLARIQADTRWQGKIDLSGLVQQTLLEAFQAARQLEGWTDVQKTAWLRQALANNLADEVRKLKRGKRDARRERSLESEMAESASRLERLLPAPQSTPSARIERQERMVRVAQALHELPEMQRRVIELHHLLGHSLAEAAGALGTTRAAAAGLLHRGLKRLRVMLDDDEMKLSNENTRKLNPRSHSKTNDQ
jgi:RNA polymerase sigma-70 factor, ECF subfamily